MKFEKNSSLNLLPKPSASFTSTSAPLPRPPQTLLPCHQGVLPPPLARRSPPIPTPTTTITIGLQTPPPPPHPHTHGRSSSRRGRPPHRTAPAASSSRLLEDCHCTSLILEEGYGFIL